MTDSFEWKDIPGYPGYQACKEGYIRAVNRKKPLLLITRRRDGTCRVVKESGKSTTVGVARLVWITFVGPPVGNVLHKGDPNDHSLGNLKVQGMPYEETEETNKDNIGSVNEVWHPKSLLDLFLDQCVEQGVGVTKEELYRAYLDFSRHASPTPRNQFFKELRELRPNLSFRRVSRSGERCHFIEGIQIKGTKHKTRFYSGKQVAELLNTTAKQVCILIRRGQLPEPVVRTKSFIRFKAEEIDKRLGIGEYK